MQYNLKHVNLCQCRVSGCYISNKPVSWNLVGVATGYIPGALFVYIFLRYFARRTAIMTTLIGVTMALVPHYLCLNAGSKSVIFLTTTMFVTSSLKIENVYAQESFPTSLRANGI